MIRLYTQFLNYWHLVFFRPIVAQQRAFAVGAGSRRFPLYIIIGVASLSLVGLGCGQDTAKKQALESDVAVMLSGADSMQAKISTLQQALEDTTAARSGLSATDPANLKRQDFLHAVSVKSAGLKNEIAQSEQRIKDIMEQCAGGQLSVDSAAVLLAPIRKSIEVNKTVLDQYAKIVRQR